MEPKTVAEILTENDKPVIAIDELGIITFINNKFEDCYGWSSHDLIGQVVTHIMPPYMRDAHNFGFSRFLVSKAPRILNQPLPLPVYCKNGSIIEAEHFIVGEKKGGRWRFAATITETQ